MKRMATVLTLVGLSVGLVLLPKAPEVLATGGNPGFPVTISTTGPTVTGVLVIDTHTDETTATCATTVVGGTGTAFAPSDTCVPDTGGALTEGPKAKYGSIRLKKGTSVAGAIFRLPTSFGVSTGCNASLTGTGLLVDNSVSTRFGVKGGVAFDNGLRNWIGPSIVNALLTALGIPLTAGEPVITDFDNIVCTPDPQNSGAPGPGILSADIVIHFVK